MKTLLINIAAVSLLCFAIGSPVSVQAQVCYGGGSYQTDGDEITDCQMGTCCQVWNACNGPYSACWNSDPDYAGTGGCDLSCAPIDSGVLFLLLGGAAFGGVMISRNRRRELYLESERV